jgi:hypothetical protein
VTLALIVGMVLIAFVLGLAVCAFGRSGESEDD